MGVRITKYQLSYMPESETRGCQPALRPHVLQGCRMYRMCRQSHCHSPAHLSPQCWAASWHPVTRRPSYFSTLPVPPTLLKLSMHFGFYVLPAPARAALWMPGVSAGSGAGRASCKVRGSCGLPLVGTPRNLQVNGRYQAQYLELLAYVVRQEWVGLGQSSGRELQGTEEHYRHPIACDLNVGLNKMRENIKAPSCKALPQELHGVTSEGHSLLQWAQAHHTHISLVTFKGRQKSSPIQHLSWHWCSANGNQNRQHSSLPGSRGRNQTPRKSHRDSPYLVHLHSNIWLLLSHLHYTHLYCSADHFCPSPVKPPILISQPRRECFGSHLFAYRTSIPTQIKKT